MASVRSLDINSVLRGRGVDELPEGLQKRYSRVRLRKEVGEAGGALYRLLVVVDFQGARFCENLGPCPTGYLKSLGSRLGQLWPRVSCSVTA